MKVTVKLLDIPEKTEVTCPQCNYSQIALYYPKGKIYALSTIRWINLKTFVCPNCNAFLEIIEEKK